MDAKRKPGGGSALLGEILLERGLITQENLDRALRVQVGGLRRLGHILIRMKCLSGEQLTDALSEQLRLPVVEVAREFRSEAGAVLPRYLCHKYGVLPLSLEPNNILRLAMADPLDAVAITDVENFTGLAVQPVLARLADIERSIGGHVRFSWQDLFNPLVYRSAARVAAAVALVALVIIGFLGYREFRVQRYGTQSIVGDSVIYKNHDLMIGHDTKDGSVNFNGRGTFANGYYGIRFDNPAQLASFVKGADRQFSAEQKEWVEWVLREKLTTSRQQVAAAAGR